VVDLETARAVIVNRMHVMRDYTRNVSLPVFKRELAALRDRGLSLPRRARRLVVRQPALLDAPARARLGELLESSQALRTVHEFRERLTRLWDGRGVVSNERLIAQLKEWCQQAEASGIRALQEFAATLRGYTLGNAAV